MQAVNFSFLDVKIEARMDERTLNTREEEEKTFAGTMHVTVVHGIH